MLSFFRIDIELFKEFFAIATPLLGLCTFIIVQMKERVEELKNNKK